MKQFLVPAMLLGLVGAVAAIAAGSPPEAPSHAQFRIDCPPSESCPFADERCRATEGPRCDGPAADECSDASGQEVCAKRCEGREETECVKKKMDCGNCKDEAPAEKP